MYIARILYPVEVLGPGKRVGIWFCGCPRRCKGCSNPELWELDERYRTTPERVYTIILKILQNLQIDGFTITGGEPMFQPKELQKLIALLRNISSDILVYTGYNFDELTSDMLSGISVLIDGAYIESRNNNCFLRGSDNQTIYVLDPVMESKYARYCVSKSNQIQNFVTQNGVISVGIHRPNFINDLNEIMPEKGLSCE